MCVRVVKGTTLSCSESLLSSHYFPSLLSSYLIMHPACHLAMLQHCSLQSQSLKWTFAITNPRPNPTQPSSLPIPPLPALLKVTWPVITVSSVLFRKYKRNEHTHTHTHSPAPLWHPCLVPASGCRAREQEAPRQSQLFQAPLLPPWAPHSLIQGSFVVLTSWNSWAAQLLMLL